MRIEYTCEDGSRTLAKWPSMALQHWLGRSRPIHPIENPEPFKLYVVGPPVPSDDNQIFLTLVYAEIERRLTPMQAKTCSSRRSASAWLSPCVRWAQKEKHAEC